MSDELTIERCVSFDREGVDGKSNSWLAAERNSRPKRSNHANPRYYTGSILGGIF